MEIPILTGLCAPPCRSSLSPQRPNYDFNAHFFFHQKTFLRPLKYGRESLRSNTSMSSSLNYCGKVDAINGVWSDSECVEVIGIGSRVDSVIDYCLSSTSSHSLRYWSIITRDSSRGQLQQRVKRADASTEIMEIPLDQQLHCKAVVLVATAGYGEDHIIAIDILRTIKSAGGLVVVVILKPFRFQGQRRQDEVSILQEKLQDSVNFFIEIDIDTLLKMDLVTLDEALKTMNRAVFLAITSVSVLISGIHQKHIESSDHNMKELTVPEAIRVLENLSKGRIGFGVGSTIENSIVQAVFDCPFFCTGLKDLRGVVFCLFSSASVRDFNDVHNIMHTFRQATGCKMDVIISTVHDPDMKLNLIATTVISFYSSEQKSFQHGGVLSKLAQHILFIFNFLRRHHLQSDNHLEIHSGEASCPPKVPSSKDKKMMLVEGVPEGFERKSSELQIFLDDESDVDVVRENDDDATEFAHPDAGSSSVKIHGRDGEGTDACQEEISFSWNSGLGNNLHQRWTDKGGAIAGGTAPMGDKPSSYSLPVGVRPSDDVNDSSDINISRLDPQPRAEDDVNMCVLATPSVSSRNALANADCEAVAGISYNVSTSLKGNYADVSKERGLVSIRAASMLEGERDSKRIWSPTMEIRYRGGIYKGHCQGGLPEGRGCLAFPDGSAYDGMWHSGKRSGLGTFYFNSGDVFQGSWRDDLMHGKGWFYFHNGDRWFANFWKGKANGEGRFYSKSGEILFGCFQDGWRHGRFLCVRVDGTRYVEIWSEGALVSSEQLES